METGKNVQKNYKKSFISMLIVLFITVLFWTFASHILWMILIFFAHIHWLFLKIFVAYTLWLLTKRYLAHRFPDFCPKIQHSMVVTQNIFVEYLPHTFSSCCQATFSSLHLIFSVCCQKEYLSQTYSGCSKEYFWAYYLIVAKNISAS